MTTKVLSGTKRSVSSRKDVDDGKLLINDTSMSSTASSRRRRDTKTPKLLQPDSPDQVKQAASLDLHRLLRVMENNAIPESESWQGILMRADMAQQLLKDMDDLATPALQDRVAQVVQKSQQIAQDMQKLDSTPSIIDTIFFPNKAANNATVNITKTTTTTTVVSKPLSKSGKQISNAQNNNNDVTMSPPTSKKISKAATTPSIVDAPLNKTANIEDLQKQQREQIEEAIRSMAAQLKAETSNLQSTLQKQTTGVLKDMETSAEDKVDQVTRASKDVREYNQKSWKRSLSKWTTFFTIVGVFLFTIVTIQMAPKYTSKVYHQAVDNIKSIPEKLPQAIIDKSTLAPLQEKGQSSQVETNGVEPNNDEPVNSSSDFDDETSTTVDSSNSNNNDHDSPTTTETTETTNSENSIDGANEEEDDSLIHDDKHELKDSEEQASDYSGDEDVVHHDDESETDEFDKGDVDTNSDNVKGVESDSDVSAKINDNHNIDDNNENNNNNNNDIDTITMPPAAEMRRTALEDFDNMQKAAKEAQQNIQVPTLLTDHDLASFGDNVQEGESMVKDALDSGDRTVPNTDVSQLEQQQQQQQQQKEEVPKLQTTAPQADITEHGIPLYNGRPFSTRDFRKAAATGDIETLRGYIKVKPEWVNSIDRNGWGPLHLAVRANKYDVVDLLLENNADKEMATIDGRNAEAMALAYLGPNNPITMRLKGEVVEEVLQLDGNPITVEDVWFAANTADQIFAERLLDIKPDWVNKQDRNGWSPLHMAARTGNVDLVYMLLRRNADKTTRTVDGSLALDIAAAKFGNDHPVVDLLSS